MSTIDHSAGSSMPLWSGGGSSREEDVMMPGYEQATSLLVDACSYLKQGQMVHMPELSLMDAMAAIQILDPRMDGGIDPVPAQLMAPCDRLPEGAECVPFDVRSPLTSDDVLWIMDRMLACEAAWLESASLSGASLSQTIHTCLYVHELASMHPNAPSDVNLSPSPFARHVLRPFLMATLKSVGLIWDELTKGNLMDGEDFNGDKAGISLLEDVNPQSVLALLDGSMSWVRQRDTIELALQDALCERLYLRKTFLASITLFSRMDPTLHFGRTSDVRQSLKEAQESLKQGQHSLERLFATARFSSPDLSSAPSAIARSAFDPWFSRHGGASKANYAPMSLAPPQPLPLGQPDVTLKVYRHVLAAMLEFTELVGPLEGWKKWKRFFTMQAATFQQTPSAPYVRSLWQSAVCSDAIVSLHKPLSFIADSFLWDVAAVEPGSLPGFLWEAARQSTSFPTEHIMTLEKRLHHFIERLSGQLVAYLRNLAQNRSRSKRRMGHLYGDLLALSDEASALGSNLVDVVGIHVLHPDLLFAAVQTLTLDTMLQSIFSGFELQLYRAGEYACIYWMAHKAADELMGILEGLLNWIISQSLSRSVQRSIDYMQGQVRWTSAMSRACEAFALLYEDHSATAGQLAWLAPTVNLNGASNDAASKASITAHETGHTLFRKRFKWLILEARPESGKHVDSLWQSFQMNARKEQEIGNTGHLTAAAALLKRAATDCRSCTTSSFEDEPRSSLAFADAMPALAGSFEAIASRAEETVQSCSPTTKDEGMPSRTCLLPLDLGSGPHPWFPVLAPSPSL